MWVKNIMQMQPVLHTKNLVLPWPCTSQRMQRERLLLLAAPSSAARVKTENLERAKELIAGNSFHTSNSRSAPIRNKGPILFTLNKHSEQRHNTRLGPPANFEPTLQLRCMMGVVVFRNVDVRGAESCLFRRPNGSGRWSFPLAPPLFRRCLDGGKSRDMIPRLPRLLFRTLRSARFAAGAAGFPSPQIPWAAPEAGRGFLGSGAVMAVQGPSLLRADSQRLEAEEEEAGRGMGEKVQLPPASEQLSQQIASSKSKPSVKKKRKRITGKESEEDNIIKKKKENQDRPNYFISVPITNPKIINGIQTLQNTIMQKDNRLSKAMIHYGSFHVTLLVMHLSSEEAISNAVGAFLESGGLIEELLQGKPVDLSFQGTDHFRNQIGFVKLTESDHTTTLLKIAEIVKKMFQEKGVIIDDKAFKPHLTFMKLSKSPKLQKQGVKRIDPNMFADFKNHYFGDELMKRLDLCSMLKKKQPNGYYHCESSIVVGEKKGAEPDDAELLSLSKRLVENAVLKAVQQYLEETQNKNRQNDCGSPVKTEEVAIGNSKESENDVRK
ncbi:A-kinase anchoring protein 7 isoform X3 [Python bivittatus]|uniref:A-kinase anchoring protein 7 isoform X3 n=1 Tax=Python bivittatus TaxID=176946 RepID=A0A9F5J7L9_PYTBI|nr:A-kinase anchoring protein 7 isoform X3 [Python bivittatus]